MPRTVVLGLDGACWPLLEPWIEAGDLPNLSALRAESAQGPLTSQLSDELLTLTQSRFDGAFDLLDEEPDFLHITILYINVLHHFPYQGQPTRAGWQLIDHNVGRLCQLVEERGYNLLLISDHGCAPVDTVFYVNTWLARGGDLAVNLSATARDLGRLGLDRRGLMGLARRWGLAPLLRRRVPARLQRALPDASGTFSKKAKGERMDWDRSLAVGS